MDDIESVEYMVRDLQRRSPKIYRAIRKTMGNEFPHFCEGKWISRTLAVAISYSYDIRYDPKRDTIGDE